MFFLFIGERELEGSSGVFVKQCTEANYNRLQKHSVNKEVVDLIHVVIERVYEYVEILPVISYVFNVSMSLEI